MKQLSIILTLFVCLYIEGFGQKPNIIYLMADDQNVGSVGCYGNGEVSTPNMDKIGDQGIIFTRHYNTTAICMASRANAMTGMYEYKTGTNFDHGDMKPEVWQKSYPVLLREAGYFTAFAGKFGFEVEGLGLCESDFDMWGGGPGQTFYATKKNSSMAKYAKEFPHSTLSYGAFGQDVIREAVQQDKPFCISISFKAPHRPILPDPKFDHVYAGKTFTKPANYGRVAGAHMSKQSKQGRQYKRFHEWEYSTDYDEVMANYYQLIYAIDVAVGMIIEELEAQGIADNTVIIYTSDNGYICGAHGFASKVLPMEESSRAPLMIYDPRSAHAGKKRECAALTGNIDFAPTILDLAGVPIPENVDGKSLVPLIENTNQEIHEQLAFINTWGVVPTQSLTCITRDWKYTYWWYGDTEMKPTEELYNLANDPLEMKNLAEDPQAETMLNAMRTRYDTELAHWKKEAVNYNNYRQYITLFDRKIPWAQKKFKKSESINEANH
ncbi:sulfatase family protein [Flexithrix dorotheae]|uniref:sulfatase family protein n=1 Tax=Flexithrix dorotheae TaxID=70993 RepID=UPI0003A01D96|nr:sulfatase [Flexithrix dorotheae]